MGLANNFKMMAHYNQRINNQLMDLCLSLPEHKLNQETHSFFPNIINYWNHILFGDLILMRRIADQNLAGLSLNRFEELPTPSSPTDIYSSSLSDFSLLRDKVDRLILEFCLGLSEQECEFVFSYTTTEGQQITKSLADVLQHLFNHQTHHRGQLTCVLSQFDIDYGCMDLPVIVSEGSLKL